MQNLKAVNINYQPKIHHSYKLGQSESWQRFNQNKKNLSIHIRASFLVGIWNPKRLTVRRSYLAMSKACDRQLSRLR